MPQHESKICPRCSQPFECKVGSILICQCSSVRLNDEERYHLSKLYTDCLCASCIKEVQAEYQTQQFQHRSKS
ncbi:cysteine-rich CWC family protein [Pontibacter silvestris]|uniref:Cysteine-rich CWC family protein n=1 Tax=Pontibacter silvestris TaxID=2305183 RepID=A0ABW4X1R1_9BACT|nr:cysteine-rich CWC family protein [Pontibacter silvestris]MCC9135741.1 cysteine-rich CWC family protein [Pontibacter silvestris]